MEKQKEREAIIIRTSVIGIGANVLLAAFKAVVGLLSNSIAITLDAVNNLDDALSSVITIIGTKLAGKPADRKHPYGHGRVEYITAMIIAVIVLYAGLTSFTESVRKILHPERPSYSAAALVIVASAVLVKIILGRYVKGVGEKVKSDSLVASGADASFDAVISASTLAAAILFMLFEISLESYLGAAISLVIIKSGYEMLSDTISEVLGRRVDQETADSVKTLTASFPEVQGVYDLTLHNYGPDKLIGSVHVEVDEGVSVNRIDEMSREITRKVYGETGIIIEAVGIYAVESHDPAILAMKDAILGIIRRHDYILETHGFHVNKKDKVISVDFVADFNCPDRKSLYADISREIQEACPDYRLMLTMDVDTSV
ncbi:MAG: cation diffusion facilitator family transporter [Bacteroidales bacterium]|nr:cation diffusion facilitator family transporter [Bacteroidales bacterium]